ncbi:MAG: AAA family ATPase [Opitutaceae bacterium]
MQHAHVIDTVVFHNFKALRNTSLRLLMFNLVIGPNGSGKTSLIQALQQLRTLSQFTLGDAAMHSRSGGPEISFTFTHPYSGIVARLGCTSDVLCDFLHVDGLDHVAWSEVKSRLATFRSYSLDHDAMARSSLRTDSAVLESNGGNLAAVLAARQRMAPFAFARMQAELLRLLPEFTGIVVEEESGGRVRFSLGIDGAGATVRAENLSQGALYMLGLLVLSFDPTPPAVVCIEEIDRGVHPRMLREVRDMLYRLSYPASFGEKREPAQVITTTHSPYMLDQFRDHPEEVVITQKLGHEARFERLSDRLDLPELLREGTLGDMWFSGVLGGVPEAQ